MKKYVVAIFFIFSTLFTIVIGLHSSGAKNPPTFEGIPEEIVYLELGDAFNLMEDIKASDSEDRDLTSNIVVRGEVNTRAIGEYTVQFTVEDRFGARSRQSAKYVVQDTRAPAFFFHNAKGAVLLNQPYDLTSFIRKVVDNVEDIDPEAVTISGEVDNTVEGINQVSYIAWDESRNRTTVEYVVVVGSLMDNSEDDSSEVVRKMHSFISDNGKVYTTDHSVFEGYVYLENPTIDGLEEVYDSIKNYQSFGIMKVVAEGIENIFVYYGN